MKDPLDAIGGETIGYDVPLIVCQAVDYSMIDDTSTDFDVYVALNKLTEVAQDNAALAAIYDEAALIALIRMDNFNDD